MALSNQRAAGSISIDALLGIYGVICLITAFFFSFESGKPIDIRFQGAATKDQPFEATQMFEVPSDDTVYNVRFHQETGELQPNSDWSAAELILIDEQGEEIMGFGSDFWRAKGYDSEGRWYEEKERDSMKLTIEKAGTYGLKAIISTNQNRFSEPLSVRLEPKQGSSLPFTILGIAAIIGAVIVHQVKKSREPMGLGEDSES